MATRLLRRPVSRRFLLGQAGLAGLTMVGTPAWGQKMIDLALPGGPSERQITTAFPQKAAMILQRTRPPLLETPFEVFDKGVFTPNDQFYVRWHWAVIPTNGPTAPWAMPFGPGCASGMFWTGPASRPAP